MRLKVSTLFFFFNDTATTEIYTLSLHDALPIYRMRPAPSEMRTAISRRRTLERARRRLATLEQAMSSTNPTIDRKSTRLNSSHLVISYAVFCLKKKKLLSFQHVIRHNIIRYRKR